MHILKFQNEPKTNAPKLCCLIHAYRVFSENQSCVLCISVPAGENSQHICCSKIIIKMVKN